MNASSDWKVQCCLRDVSNSSQHSMGPIGLLDLCEVYKAANKWNKLNMDIIRHYQSAAVPQGFSRLEVSTDLCLKSSSSPTGAGVILFYPIGQSAYLLQSLQMAL